MPKIVQLPSGEEVEFPDNMADSAIESVLQKQFKLAAPPPPPMNVDPSAGMSPGEKMLVGAGAAASRAGRGITNLMRDVMPEEWFPKGKPVDTQGAEDAALYQKYHPGGWATTGEVLADVGLSALPVSKAAMLPRALGMTGRVAPAIADIGANAAYAAATSPENRGQAALYGGAGAAGGRVLNRALSGLVKPTPAAQELLEQGVRLTPGQAGGGKGIGALARVYEQGLEAVPGAGNLVSGARQRGLEDWNRYLTRQLDPTTLPLGIDTAAPVGAKGLERAAEDISTLYQRAFPQGQVFQMPPAHLLQYDSAVSELANKVAPSVRPKFREVADWLKQNLEAGIPAEQWKEVVQGEINGAIKAAQREGSHSLVKSLSALDTQLKHSLERIGGPSVETVKALDKRYASLKSIQAAGAKAGPIQRGGVLYPSEVATTASKGGRAPILLKQALEAQELYGRAPNAMDKLGNMVKAGAVGVAGHTVVGGMSIPIVLASLLGTTEAGRKFLLGQTSWQQFLATHPGFLTQLGRATATQGQ
jgi:hypothetical protein